MPSPQSPQGLESIFSSAGHRLPAPPASGGSRRPPSARRARLSSRIALSAGAEFQMPLSHVMRWVSF